jgi:hypothetical protein
VEVPVSKEGKDIKITDKRMFTADGELRQEYRFLEETATAANAAPSGGEPAGAAPAARPADQAASPSAAAVAAAASPGSGRAAGPAAASGRAEQVPVEPAGRPQRPERPERPESFGGGGAGESGALLDLPGSPPGLGASFYDLAAMLAEPVAIYLGDIELPDGGSAENLEMARLHIDLLDVLRQKTAGNLTGQESAFLEDLLYRLRVRYVQKRG